MRTQVTGCEFTFSRNLHHAFNWENLRNYLTFARSRDVNGHVSDVTIPLDIGNFLLVVLWNQDSMATGQPFLKILGTNNNGATTFLSKSRDVIGDVTGHVTIPLSINHFLWVVHCDQAIISSHFKDIVPEK